MKRKSNKGKKSAVKDIPDNDVYDEDDVENSEGAESSGESKSKKRRSAGKNASENGDGAIQKNKRSTGGDSKPRKSGRDSKTKNYEESPPTSDGESVDQENSPPKNKSGRNSKTISSDSTDEKNKRSTGGDSKPRKSGRDSKTKNYEESPPTSDGESVDQENNPPKNKSRRNSKTLSSDSTDEENKRSTGRDSKSRKSGRDSKIKNYEESPPTSDGESVDQENSPPKKKSGRNSKTISSDSTDEEEEDNQKNNSPKKKRAKKSQLNDDDSGDENDKNGSSSEEEEQEYEVDKIIDDKKIRGQLHYLIRWKGYGPEGDTWEPEATLSCPEALNEYKKKVDKKPKTPKKSEKKISKVGPEPQEKWDENENFEVLRILDVYFRRDGKREFLVSWKGYPTSANTWEPEENMDCKDMIQRFLKKCSDARDSTQKELRLNRKTTDRFTLSTKETGRRLSKRNTGKQRVQYHDAE